MYYFPIHPIEKEPLMRHVLCFGDSNTWGFVPATPAERFDFDVRYPGVLQARLGPKFRVIEEGLNGRMSAWNDPLNPHKNALEQIDFILETHRPLDFIVMMLGTNDIKHYMKVDAIDSALAQNALIDRIEAAQCGRGGKRPTLVLVAPPLVVEAHSPFGRVFEDAIPKSKGFAMAYAEIAKQRKCYFLDGASVAPTSRRDGIHLEKESHQSLGEAVAQLILKAS
jgi:lysophospholipase L1-like esterase